MADTDWPFCDACHSWHHPNNPTCALNHSHSQDMGRRRTPWGTVRYIKIRRDDERPMRWSEVWATFDRVYPGQWAIEFFPPREELVDEANIYHLFVLDEPPVGFDLREKPERRKT